MSNIFIITAVYPPEPVVSARMGKDLADNLRDQKHKVTVVCPQPSRPANADYGQYKKAGIFVVLEEDIEVVRLPSFAAPTSSLLLRLRESVSFGRSVCRFLSKNPIKPDVLYVNAWPLIAQALIVNYASRHGIAVVLQIMDIYPESLLNKLPAFVNKIIAKPLISLDAWLARTARTVIVISEKMREIYTDMRSVHPERIIAIPTWQDEQMFETQYVREAVCQKYGIPDAPFTFFFLGNIGPVAGVDFLITAFHQAAIKSAQLVIVGDGSAKSSCIKYLEDLNLSNVYLISDPDVANVPMLHSIGHICMLPLKQGAGHSSIPSKLPAYLFSAKAVIATVDKNSDTAEFIRTANCGWVGDPEDLSWLVDKMKEVAKLPQCELERLGQNGKELGLTYFSKKSGVTSISNAIIQATGPYL